MEIKRLRERHPTLLAIGIAVANAVSGGMNAGDRHSHDVVEIFCLRSGHAEHRIGSRKHRLSPGSVGIVHYDQAHGFSGGPFTITNLFLDLSLLPIADVGELHAALHAIMPMHPSMRHLLHTGVHLRMPKNGFHVELLDRLRDEQESRREGMQQAMRSLTHLFLVELARAAKAAGLASTDRAHAAPMLEFVRRRLDEQWREAVSIPVLAKLAGCAPETLMRGFRRYTGETVIGYTQRLRIEAAQQLLATTDDTVLAIAHAVGFNDQAFFNRVFRRRARCTPATWRKRARAR